MVHEDGLRSFDLQTFGVIWVLSVRLQREGERVSESKRERRERVRESGRESKEMCECVVLS